LRQTGGRPHPCNVRYTGPVSLLRPSRRCAPSIFHGLHFPGTQFVCFLAIFSLATSAQRPVANKPGTQTAKYAANSSANHLLTELEVLADPPGLLYQGVPAEIPQDEGGAGLRLELLRLGTTARLMQVVAHPDDEDGGMLTLESRGRGVSTLLMTLNRGEGGQNKIGSNLSDVLGVLRAEELLASDQYYGVQERFSRVADFGFSKSAEETFAKWGGHDTPLGDIVRVIRTFRPDVLVARFSGTSRDGHGHHQASAILTQEAFRAAADPKRFPEQLSQGLQPWQAKKLYIGNVCGFGAMTCPDADWTLKLNTGERSAELGMSYVQFAMQGLRHQMSQGAANWTVDAGDRFTFYRLVDSVAPSTLDKDGHEKSFFDGIDTSLPGLMKRLGVEGTNDPWLGEGLASIAADVREATAAKDGAAAAKPLMAILRELDSVMARLRRGGVRSLAVPCILQVLDEKHQQAERALNLALGVSLTADVSSDGQREIKVLKEADALTTVSPGQEFLIAVTFHNGSKQPLVIDHIKLDVPAGWNTLSGKTRPEAVAPGEDLHANFRLRVPKDAKYTRPYWHRDDPDTEAVNHIDDEKYATLPFPPPALQARVEYSLSEGGGKTRNGITSVVVTPFVDDAGKTEERPLAVAPAFSVMLEPGTQVISTHHGSESTVAVGVTSNLTRDARGVLRLELPPDWRSEPAQVPVELKKRGDKQDFQFRVVTTGLKEGRAAVRAVLESGGEKYAEGYTLVTREDLGSFYYYQPARQRVSIVDVQVPHDLKVGYVMGAGDDIPAVLKQVGLDVTLIPAEKIADEDLSKYGTIVLGIRAYDTQKDVAANNKNNKKLLDFVSAGGTLLVQYNAGTADFNAGKFTPYPANLSRARVSVEEAPVEILAPDDSVFHYPNTITARDFDGWVQERGLYFMDKWDEHFTPLLSCHDPGEDAQKGGLLRAQYGKGTYIYSGYAFFRQLPAGVPGAVRLYVNLLSAGHNK
jgi:LmbE family N-acetylglucosaminyl deacetylase